MAVLPISDANDARLAPYRDLGDAELLRGRGLFVAEGRLIVERVLADARYRVESLLLNAASLEALGPVLASASTDLTVFECPTTAFETITGYNMHRGCLALVRRPAPVSWKDAVGTSRIVVVLEGVTNADNVGGVFRNAAAFGAGAVLLSPTCCDPLYRKAIRTSMGAVLRVPFARVEPWPEALIALREAGVVLTALTPRSDATPIHVSGSVGQDSRLALLVGTEGAGLSPSAEGLADRLVRIPMRAGVDSLNLAVATGIALSRMSDQISE